MELRSRLEWAFLGLILAGLAVRLTLVGAFLSIDLIDFEIYALAFRQSGYSPDIYSPLPQTYGSLRALTPYNYPPLWLLAISGLLTLSELAAIPFHVLAKILLALIDVLIASLIYSYLGGGRHGVLGGSLYLFCYTSLFVSAGWGQMDNLPTLLLFTAMILADQKRHRLAGLLAGLALMAKQWVVFPLALFTLHLWWWDRKGLSRFLTPLLAVVLLLSLPFASSIGRLINYLSVVWLGRLTPPTLPWELGLKVWSHNQLSGFYQVAALILDLVGRPLDDFMPLGRVWVVPLALTLYLAVRRVRQGRISLNHSLLMGLVAFLVSSYLLHPQHTVAVIPFLIVQLIRQGQRLWWFALTFIPTPLLLLTYTPPEVYTYLPAPIAQALTAFDRFSLTPLSIGEWTGIYLVVPPLGLLYTTSLLIYFKTQLIRAG